jgi:hypothetical protein
VKEQFVQHKSRKFAVFLQLLQVLHKEANALGRSAIKQLFSVYNIILLDSVIEYKGL